MNISGKIWFSKLTLQHVFQSVSFYSVASRHTRHMKPVKRRGHTLNLVIFNEYKSVESHNFTYTYVHMYRLIIALAPSYGIDWIDFTVFSNSHVRLDVHSRSAYKVPHLGTCLNSLWSTNAIWRHRSWSTLGQEMACVAWGHQYITRASAEL